MPGSLLSLISAEDHREAEEASDGYEPCACDAHFLRSAASLEGNAGYAHQISRRQTGRDGKRAHEEIRDLPAGTLKELRAELDENDPRGEYVILVEGWNEDMAEGEEEKASWEAEALELAKTLPQKEAARKIAAKFHMGRRDVYQYLLKNGD